MDSEEREPATTVAVWHADGPHGEKFVIEIDIVDPEHYHLCRIDVMHTDSIDGALYGAHKLMNAGTLAGLEWQMASSEEIDQFHV